MAHFAQIDQNNIVVNVIVAEQSLIDTGALGEPSSFIQTSFNTFGGKHDFNGTPLRKNFAGIGFIYDKNRDAFIPPKPYASWTLNEETCLWESPISRPSDWAEWDEESLSWI